MAKDKKSFVLYSDLIKSIEHLTNEEKGILFNHLLEYVNDLNPILTDRLILTAWKPIELQLKRDLVKFEEVKAKRSEAGKRSAELKAQKKEEQTSTNSTSVDFVKQTSTNSTDSDSVNVNEIDNVILLEKETKEDLTENEILPLTDEIPKRKKVALKKEINLPSDFIEIWDLWLEYRKAKKIKDYASDKFEQMAIDKLLRFSNNNAILGRQIIEESITNSWTGFFELKINNQNTNSNGKGNTNGFASNR